MKKLVMIACVLLAGSAWAQPPVEVKPDQVISIGIGQTRIFRFDEPISQVNVVSKGIVEAQAQTDHQISLVGESEGETHLYVFSPDNKRMFEARVVVTTESGHIVRLYGYHDDSNKDFQGFYCTEAGCGRADKDLPNRGLPTSTQTTITQRTGAGSISTTKSYGTP